MPSAEHQALCAIAIAAARAGARAALRHAPTACLPPITVETKGDASPVTRADRESEAAIRNVIAGARPGDAWLGEETGTADRLDAAAPATPYRWIVDPIDGTRNFVRGVPLWAVLVACTEIGRNGHERVVAAAVEIPGQGEAYDAVLGGGARCNGERLRVSPVATLDRALFCYETPGWFRSHGLGRVFERLLERTALSRGLCDAYGHMLVASGRAELAVEPHLSVWDVAATSLVVSEAGGRFSDLAGTPAIRSGHAVVSNALVHDDTLAIIRAEQEP